eukprot:TRINITY_DN4563_c1_g1_i1.p1 TRINITY_DN4563_c1_g1~~TRINITY_DN4563_c1_g1_i1.p1  ORF type:complete len:193 (+),score=40.92 TRINITY_DN4563_c1_g1_i1:87-665(+)
MDSSNKNMNDLNTLNNMLWESVYIQESIFATIPFGIALWHCRNKNPQEIEVILSSSNQIAREALYDYQLGSPLNDMDKRFTELHRRITESFSTKTNSAMLNPIRFKDDKSYIVKIFANVHQNYVCSHFIEIPQNLINHKEEIETEQEIYGELFPSIDDSPRDIIKKEIITKKRYMIDYENSNSKKNRITSFD